MDNTFVQMAEAVVLERDQLRSERVKLQEENEALRGEMALLRETHPHVDQEGITASGLAAMCERLATLEEQVKHIYSTHPAQQPEKALAIGRKVRVKPGSRSLVGHMFEGLDEFYVNNVGRDGGARGAHIAYIAVSLDPSAAGWWVRPEDLEIVE